MSKCAAYPTNDCTYPQFRCDECPEGIARGALLTDCAASWCYDMAMAPKEKLIEVILVGEYSDISFYCPLGYRGERGDAQWVGISHGWHYRNMRWRPSGGLGAPIFIQPVGWRLPPELPRAIMHGFNNGV